MQKPHEKQNYSARVEPAVVHLRVPADCAGLRLDQALARLLPAHSRSRLAQWVREERVILDGCAAIPRAKLRGGESLEVRPMADPGASGHLPQDIPLRIVHEDESIIVIDKPPGLVVHPGSGNWDGTLLNALLQHEPALADVPRAGIVHRLDKDTSGLLVVAKTLTAQTDLVRQLQARTVKREYAAIAHGRVVRDGTIEAPIGRHPVSRTRMAVVSRGKPAVTHYRVVERYAHATLLECRLETGRTHQIRVHLASITHPLLGDPVYGKRSVRPELAFHRQALHAQKLGLIHPASREPMSWAAPIPEDLRTLMATLASIKEPQS
jgi:23S rRNA pseudouridine1911/1915/1917 synthase